MNRVKLSLLTVVLLSSSIYADHSLEQIEISSGSSVREVAQNEAFSAPASSKLTTDTLTQEDLEIANPKNVLEALNLAIGSNVQFQGRKNSAIITFRGSSNIYSAAAFGVILDGALLAPMSSLRMMESLSMEIIESIEVIRDASALTLGPIAGFGTPNGSPTLGYIVIKTKLPKQNGGSAKFAYESFNTKKANISYGGIHDNIFYLASVDGLNSHGRKEYNTNQERGSLFVRSGYIDDSFSAIVSAYYSHEEKETQKATHSMSAVADSEWKYEPMENKFISAIFEKEFNQNNTTTLQLSHTKASWSQDFDRTDPSKKPPLYFKGTQSTDSIDLRHSTKVADAVLKFGAQALFYDAPKGELFYEGFRRKEQIYGFFAHASKPFMEDKLIVDLSLRLDKKHIDSSLERYDPNSILAQNVTKLNNTALGVVEDTWAKDSKALSLGVLYHIDDITEATLRFGYMESGAASDQKSGDGSPLKDEKSYRYEAGIKQYISSYFTPTLNLFLYDDKSKKRPLYYGTNADPYIVFNQVDQKRYGGELGLEGRFNSLYYSLGYAYATANSSKNEIPKHIVTSLLQKKLGGGYALNFSGKYISKYESNFFTKDKKYHDVGDFVSINLSLEYNHKLLDNDAKLTLYSRNLLDKEYMSIFGFEDQGRVVGASYEFKF